MFEGIYDEITLIIPAPLYLYRLTVCVAIVVNSTECPEKTERCE